MTKKALNNDQKIDDSIMQAMLEKILQEDSDQQLNFHFLEMKCPIPENEQYNILLE
jgi:hypothetical protein